MTILSVWMLTWGDKHQYVAHFGQRFQAEESVVERHRRPETQDLRFHVERNTPTESLWVVRDNGGVYEYHVKCVPVYGARKNLMQLEEARNVGNG
jgi:hypothetical protein